MRSPTRSPLVVLEHQATSTDSSPDAFPDICLTDSTMVGAIHSLLPDDTDDAKSPLFESREKGCVPGEPVVDLTKENSDQNVQDTCHELVKTKSDPRTSPWMSPLLSPDLVAKDFNSFESLQGWPGDVMSFYDADKWVMKYLDDVANDLVGTGPLDL